MAAMVDVVFELRGHSVPQDHGYGLFRALCARLDWLDEELGAGVHPINGTVSDTGEIFLGRRARLALRLPVARAAEAMGLEGARLEVGSGLEVGAGRTRELAPFGTQYSHFVSTAAADEAEFLGRADALLKAAGLPCTMICGKPHRAMTPAGEVRGFSLLLHGLTAEQSLAVQEQGLGEGRKLGCGIFVPHKSLAAVG
jgi:CRISPR-associated protein Cas6